MPFTKTEVDIHDDYVVEAVDAAWLAQGVKSPEAPDARPRQLHPVPGLRGRLPVELHLDDVDRTSSQDADEDAVEAEVGDAYAVFVVDDNACTRCSVCVDRCPTDTLYYARLPEDCRRQAHDGRGARVAERPRSRNGRGEAG